VATEEYRRRVIQLGENPVYVFRVGGLGVDNIRRLTLLDRKELETAMGISFGSRNLLITFHPVTLEHNTSEAGMAELLAALSELQETQLLFTLPNADTDGRVLFRQIENFVAQHSHAHVFTSLGQLRYLSCIAQVDAVVGNSSSGLTEAPSFKKGTINIGDRQKGRQRAASVIDCEPDRVSIRRAIDRLYSREFQAQLPYLENPYDGGNASARIVAVLEQQEFGSLLKKQFFDLT
jgi:GDP/UDP-N,N'-diacetylbacillosamine 2-epimerase (hydrolysing)